jgi:vacuolar-type H+-ATPase subunit F/Vma7
MTEMKRLEIAVVGDEDLVNGLRLGGVRRYRIIEETGDVREQVRAAVSEFLNEPDIGIIAILEEYSEDVADIIAKAREKKSSSVVIIEVPSKYGTRYKDINKYYKDYIRKIIGFDIEI